MKPTKIVYALTCPACGRFACDPTRVYGATGTVIDGCVDHFHTGHLVVPSASSAWHNKVEAHRVRETMREMRGGYVTERP